VTISSSRSYNPTIDKIAKQAMVLSGLVNANADINSTNHAADAYVCRQHISDVLDDCAAYGVILRHLRFVDVDVVASDSTYVQDDEVLDVLGDGMLTLDTGGSETLVKQIGIDDWHRLTDKTSEGHPTQMFAYREGPTVELRLWPIPDSAATLRFQAHIKPADSTNGSDTIDLPPYWRSYVQFEVAHRFCLGKGLDAKGAYLAQMAAPKLQLARVKSQSRPSAQGRVGHRTGWSR
jgi:hypothetical protein